MATFTGINVGGDSPKEITDALIALNRTLEYQMANLDDDNIRELDYSKMIGAPPANADNTSEQLPNTLGINFTKIGVNYIYTGTLNANQINVGTLTGFTIRTASGGRRVEMDYTGFRSYDSSGIKRVSIENTDPTWGNHQILFYGSNGGYSGSLSGDSGYMTLNASQGTLFIGGRDGISLIGTGGTFDFKNFQILNFNATAKFG